MLKHLTLYFKLCIVTIILSLSGLISADNENASDKQLLERFFVAAKSNDIKSLNQLLSAGVKIDNKDSQGRTALLLATHSNSIEAAKFLIDKGADVNAKDNIQDSPYLYAGAEGRLEILKLTVAAGADLKSINRYGGTALTPAAHHGHIDVVKFLLTTKTDVNQVNFLGWTALLEAVILGDGGSTYQTIVKLLLDVGADKEITDDEDVSPLEHARSRGYSELVNLLEE